jgi:hypothetical protein
VNLFRREGLLLFSANVRREETAAQKYRRYHPGKKEKDQT